MIREDINAVMGACRFDESFDVVKRFMDLETNLLGCETLLSSG